MMIQVEHLTVGYERGKNIITDMSFSVKKGEIFGFLGSSGAGKSTLQKVLTGMLTGYEGSASVAGVECRCFDRDFYEKIGVDFEYSTMYEKLTARENLKFFGSLYNNGTRDIEKLLDAVGLLADADKRLESYSKGMRSRVNFIKAILHDPEILYLDEPTSGLDPANSKKMKELIKGEQKRGKTILLTTHNMQDATELCDRVAFIVNGKICALDSPHHLIMEKGAKKVTYTWEEHGEQTAECRLEEIGNEQKLLELIRAGRLRSIHSSEPTLNDIFVELTGESLG